MSRIGFYHLTKSPLERALPKLLEKALGAGNRCVVLCGSKERVAALDSMLWTYDPDSWLPHGQARDGEPSQHPIWLTDQDENPNRADVLVLVDGMTSESLGSYARCLDLFDGQDEAALAAARARWKATKEAGHELEYWQQDEKSGWIKAQ
ncbi:MAG: DNA polymerase III subunit chi [Rhodospirillales bacterium]|nr:MAG: DNA polymerase III subunit chi [Rhodospirillales bacterium]